MGKLKQFLLNWLPVLVWMGLIFFLSSRMMPKTSQIYWTDFIMKKTAHLIEYAILGLLNYRALRRSGVAKNKAFYLAFIISAVFAASDELHQYFVPGREARVRDVIIDIVGCGIPLGYIKLS